jgi:hypothetical protein
MDRVPLGPGLHQSGVEAQPQYLVNGIFADVRGGALTKVALSLFNKRYEASHWENVGPKLITEAAIYIQKRQLGAFELLKNFDFLPVHWSRTSLLTAPLATVTPDQLFAVSHAVQLHVFGGASLFNLTHETKGLEEKNLLGATMLNRCPLTYCASRRPKRSSP